MRISQLATRAGLPVSTLRHYEARGLLPAQRSEEGYRVFDEQSMPRLKFIRAAKAVGLPLEEIGLMLTAWNANASKAERSRMRPVLGQRLDAINAQITDLSAFREALNDALAQLAVVDDQLSQIGRGTR